MQNILSSEDEICKLDEYAESGIMPSGVWERRLLLANKQERRTVISKMVYHFYVKNVDHSRLSVFPLRKLYNIGINTDFDALNPNDLFPRCDLEAIWNQYERESFTFPPNRNEFDRLQEIYHKIKESENDDEAWFEAIQLFKDIYFVEHNMEARIGDNMMNKKLWHAYLDYLEENDHKTLLQTYSKYVRVFKDENDMIEKYRKAAAKYGPVLVPWKNPLDFEIHDPIYFEKILQSKSQSYPDENSNCKLQCMFHFNNEISIAQKFSIPLPLVMYIREAASGTTLHKLHKCCKSFYIRRPVAIVYSFMNGRGCQKPFQIMGHSIEISPIWLHNLSIQKISIVNYMHFDNVNDSLSNSLSQFMPKIISCSAKYICIRNQMLSLNNLRTITGRNRVKQLELLNVKDENGEDYLMDDLLEMMTNADDINIHNVRMNADSMQKLLESAFNQKIKWLNIRISGHNVIDADAVSAFKNRFCIPGAIVVIKTAKPP